MPPMNALKTCTMYVELAGHRNAAWIVMARQLGSVVLCRMMSMVGGRQSATGSGCGKPTMGVGNMLERAWGVAPKHGCRREHEPWQRKTRID